MYILHSLWHPFDDFSRIVLGALNGDSSPSRRTPLRMLSDSLFLMNRELSLSCGDAKPPACDTRLIGNLHDADPVLDLRKVDPPKAVGNIG